MATQSRDQTKPNHTASAPPTEARCLKAKSFCPLSNCIRDQQWKFASSFFSPLNTWQTFPCSWERVQWSPPHCMTNPHCHLTFLTSFKKASSSVAAEGCGQCPHHRSSKSHHLLMLYKPLLQCPPMSPPLPRPLDPSEWPTRHNTIQYTFPSHNIKMS